MTCGGVFGRRCVQGSTVGSETVKTTERLRRLLAYIGARLLQHGTSEGTFLLYLCAGRVRRELYRRQASPPG